ncbi:MAG: glycosyltransferase family 4 protein [Smithella sp.]|jgi:glycosyltransferase involved in cell wall biosynthesis
MYPENIKRGTGSIEDALMTIATDTEIKRDLNGLKICRIATVPYFMVSQLKSQAEYLRDLGMQVMLVSSAGSEWSNISVGKGLSIKIINIPRSLAPLQDFIALLRLVFFFRRQRFDIVHSTTPKAGLLAAIAGLITGIPVRLHTFTGQPWVSLKGLIRWSSRAADKLIGVLNTRCYADSISQAEFLVAEGVVSKENIDVIGQGSLAGVDTARFNPDYWPMSRKREVRKTLGIGASSRILIFVGRISPDKGISELIAAFKELLQSGYDVDLLLVGPQDLNRGGFSSIDLKEKDRCHRIHYTGYTDCPEQYYAVADIFCLPSYREGFGTVVIEAAAMGLPTVGTAIYGLTDAVIDGATGILVPPRNEYALFEALKNLLDHPDKLQAMGAAAKARCFELFESGIVNGNVAREYLRVLKTKKKISNS